MSPLPEPEDFLSGQTGHVAGVRRTLARGAGDAILDLGLRRRRAELDRLAAAPPRRSVWVLCVRRPASRLADAALAELRATRHEVHVRAGSTAELGGGKFQNLNALAGGAAADWTLVVDDDVELPAGFLDRFLGICEHEGFALAQPAQTLRSHAAWPVTRRRAGALARETGFVEIGPVTAFRREAAETLMPFPDLRFGWGLDLHWAALARERGWRLGIVDATPVRHEQSPVATSYPAADAIAEAQRFLAERPYVPAREVLGA